MELFDILQIENLDGQLGGDHQQATRLVIGSLGQRGQVDSEQHDSLLQQ
jgi:hypothetical protein